MGDLRKCPFCGSDAHVLEDQRFAQKPYNFPKWYIICKECGVQTPTANMYQVVKIWNKRINTCLPEIDKSKMLDMISAQELRKENVK